MNPILKNILGVVLGIVMGSIINMGIIHFGNMLIPLPEGVDTNTAEGLKTAIRLFEFKHFLTPFFAHALGTLVGAIVAARIAATNKLKIALTIGFFFFLGGFSMIFMITFATLVFAYRFNTCLYSNGLSGRKIGWWKRIFNILKTIF